MHYRLHRGATNVVERGHNLPVHTPALLSAGWEWRRDSPVRVELTNICGRSLWSTVIADARRHYAGLRQASPSFAPLLQRVDLLQRWRMAFICFGTRSVRDSRSRLCRSITFGAWPVTLASRTHQRYIHAAWRDGPPGSDAPLDYEPRNGDTGGDV